MQKLRICKKPKRVENANLEGHQEPKRLDGTYRDVIVSSLQILVHDVVNQVY